jgi:hypothetical protein
MAYIGALAGVVAILTILSAGVAAAFPKVAKEFVEEGVHRRHAGNNSKEIRLGCAPPEPRSIVICFNQHYCEKEVLLKTYKLDFLSAQT